MAEPLNRPLADHRLLREVSGPDLTVSLGSGLKAVYETPTMGELVGTSLKLGNSLEGFSNEQRVQLRDEEIQRQENIRNLSNLITDLPDGQQRDDALAELQGIDGERDVQIDGITRDAIEQGRLQEASALTEEYSELGLTFDRPMTNEQAAILADGKRAEIIRNALIEKSPQGLGAGFLKFGAGLAAMATDPLEIATTFIPIAGPAAKARAIGRLGQVGGRAAIGAAEGAVGQALVEPIYYGLSKQQQLDYTMADALTNVGFGFLFGGGIGGIAGVLGRRAEKTRLDPGLEREAAEISFRQFATDQSVDVTRFYDGRDIRSQVPITRSGGVEFQQPIPAREGYDFRPSYIQSNEDGSPLRFTNHEEAVTFVNESGGTVVQLDDGFAIQNSAQGDFVRTATGKPVEFTTLERAERFLISEDYVDSISDRDLTISGLKDSLEEARAGDVRSARPLTQFLRDSGKGGGDSLQVHPDGSAAEELKSLGITPRSAPGLFSRAGRKDFDNLVASEFESEFPGIIEASGTSRNELYLDRDGFLDLLRRDIEGEDSWLISRADVRAIEDDIEQMLYGVDLDPKSGYLADLKRDRRFIIDVEQYEFLHGTDASDQIAKDFDAYLRENDVDFLSPEDASDILSDLQSGGGDVASIVDSYFPSYRNGSESVKVTTPTGSKVVRLANDRYVISNGMTDSEIRSIEIMPDSVSIPRGIDTRKPALLPDQGLTPRDALTGGAAQRQMSSEIAAKASDISSDPYASVSSSQKADDAFRGKADLEAGAREDIDYLQNVVDQIERDGQLDSASRAQIEELNQIDEHARAYREVVEAAATCLVRS